MNLNKTIIVGRVTRDVELKALPSGTAVSTFSLATNRVWTKDGEKHEETEFHNIVVFGKMAETVGQYVKKGQLLLVEGRLQIRSWDDKDGKKMYRTEIMAESFQFGPKAGGEKSSPSDREEIEYPDDDDSEINPEDIPF